MVINNPAYKKAIQSLWDGRATVTVRVGRLNEATGRTEPVEQVTVKDAGLSALTQNRYHHRAHRGSGAGGADRGTLH